jgi:antitoxin component of MazEF toxin-antitoxin module
MMIRKLIRIGDDVAVVLDKPLLQQLGLDENSEVKSSINGQALVVIRNAPRRINNRYG